MSLRLKIWLFVAAIIAGIVAIDIALGYLRLEGMIDPAAPGADVLRKAALHHWSLGFSYRLAGHVALLLVLGAFLGRVVTQRLTPLESATRRMAEGDFTALGPTTGSDEIATLGRAFNEMAAAVCVRDAALKEREGELLLAHAAFSSMSESVMVTDGEGSILEVNPAFSEITGYSRAEAIGANPRILKSGMVELAQYQAMWQSLREHGRWEGEFWNRRKDGGLYLQHLDITAIAADATAPLRYVAVAADVTALREHERRLEHLAYHDALTGLPNRTLLLDRLRQSMAQVKRRGLLLALCILDLDDFKSINDLSGHATGDKLLKDVAGRLQDCVRAGDTVARIGGDEFAFTVGDAHSHKEIEQAVRRVLQAVASPFRIDQTERTLSASIGITVYPLDDDEADSPLRHADQAMYAAKKNGGGDCCFYDPEGERRHREQRDIVEQMKLGLSRGEFRLFFQPKVDMRQGRVIGAEALIRWQHPELGLLLPSHFLQKIENSGLSIALGEWVIREALRQMQAWAAAGLVLPVSVNISGYHLQQPNFVARLRNILNEFPTVAPGWLEIEILETVAMEDVMTANKVIEECMALGVHFSLDDFGTGYSSLIFFRRLPARLLKIDQSFVRHMLDDADDLALVEGVINLSRAFGRRVIAEGVESAALGIPLLHYGCDQAQGYGIARPMPAEAIPAWVCAWRRPPEWNTVAAGNYCNEDFPLLIADCQHRHYIEHVTRAVETGIAKDQPALNPSKCQLGKWLGAVGQARHAHLSSFGRLAAAHEKLHAIGTDLLLLHANDPRASRDRLPEIEAAGKELFGLIDELKGSVFGPSVFIQGTTVC